jgi:hypothetical protein
VLCKASTVKVSLARKDFREFLASRYGNVMAEKW